MYFWNGVSVWSMYIVFVNKGLKLWKRWVDQYKETPLSELQVLYSRFNTKKGYGYSTLKMLASQCNKKITDKDHTYQLFEVETEIETKTFNERYISNHDKPIYDLEKYDTIYVKSPMGTGKSHTLHELFKTNKYNNILYLSSRRAFACSMANEFYDDGFKNYLDEDFSGYESKIIISPESLFKLKTDTTFDLVVIDESESIIKIISSPTLQNDLFDTNTFKFMEIIKNSDKVIVMDAFLQQRSINAISDLRNPKESLFWINEYKQESKQLINYSERQIFIDALKSKLKDGKKCVFVCGNRELGKQISLELSNKYKVQFYSRDNKLPNKANVNDLWNGLDLLIYTPTITCGISFTVEHYDELFMCISNVGSCIPRDLIQASRRVRKFKSNNLHFFLSNNMIGLDDNNMPMEKEAI